MVDEQHEPAEPFPRDEERLRERRHLLKGQVRSAPRRLDLREELAAVYRAEGNASQAGRWSYLAEHADPAETQAFARSCRHDPVEMMRALRWTGSADDAGTEVARERLQALRVQAHHTTGRWVSWEQPAPAGAGWVLAALALGALLVLALVGVGAVTVVRWVAGLW